MVPFSYLDSTPTTITIQGPIYCSYSGQSEAEKARLRRIRNDRMKQLRREIQMARQRLREYDHLQAELRQLQRDQAIELEETLRKLDPRRVIR